MGKSGLLKGQPCPLCGEPRQRSGWLTCGAPACVREVRSRASASRAQAPEVFRFLSKVEMTPGCWKWQGSVIGGGYGRFWAGGSYYSAHRWAFEYIGKQHILNGMVIDHICRNRLCVNPAHLRLVTQQQNATENSVGPSAENAARAHCRRGHAYSGTRTGHSPQDGSRRSRFCHVCHRGRQARYRRRAREHTERFLELYPEFRELATEGPR